jgi:archaellum component FlaG (FlaF/FlaG flagellin family)
VREVTPSTISDPDHSPDASSGATEYPCIYVKNTHGSIALQSAVLWIVTDANPGDIAIALGGEGKNGTAETVANENTAPVGESFTSPASKGAGLSLGTLNAGDTYPIWVRRTIPASTGAANDSFTIRVEGDTGP